MYLRSRISHAAELKKLTYRILKNTRVLEGNKRTSRVLDAVYDGVPYVLLCLGHLQRLMASSIGGINHPEVTGPGKRYLAKLESVRKAAEAGIARDVTLQKGLVPDLLTLHTRVFNSILEKGIVILIDGDEWGKVCLTAVTIWGDRL